MLHHLLIFFMIKATKRLHAIFMCPCITREQPRMNHCHCEINSFLLHKPCARTQNISIIIILAKNGYLYQRQSEYVRRSLENQYFRKIHRRLVEDGIRRKITMMDEESQQKIAGYHEKNCQR